MFLTGTVLVVQGVIAAGALLLRNVMDAPTILAVTATRGLMLGIALGLLELKPVRVASFLPALILAPPRIGRRWRDSMWSPRVTSATTAVRGSAAPLRDVAHHELLPDPVAAS